MGHYIGLESSYLRPTEDELMAEYLKAVDLLTISEEKHLRHQVEKLKTEVSDIDTLKRMHFDTKMELEKYTIRTTIRTRGNQKRDIGQPLTFDNTPPRR
jgi:hypothetical protein